MCDIKIKGLPIKLTGHIIPNLSIASLLGIQVLTIAGCEVTFDKQKCIVRYNGNVILQGKKDPSTDLWTLPLGSPWTHTRAATPANHCPSNASAHMATTQIAFFMHTVRNKANSICFTHQSLCSQRISTLLKAIQCGYLKGCPNLTKHGVTKYLNPSPASAKGHMKRPCHSIWSMCGGTAPTVPYIIPAAHAPSLQGSNMSYASNQSNLQPTNMSLSLTKRLRPRYSVLQHLQINILVSFIATSSKHSLSCHHQKRFYAPYSWV